MTRASVLIDTVYCHVCHVAGVGVVEGEAEAGEGDLHLLPACPDTPHPRLPARRATLYLLSFTHSIQCHHLMRNHRCVRPGCHLQRERSTTCKIIVSFKVYFTNYLDIILDANFIIRYRVLTACTWRYLRYRQSWVRAPATTAAATPGLERERVQGAPRLLGT